MKALLLGLFGLAVGLALGPAGLPSTSRISAPKPPQCDLEPYNEDWKGYLVWQGDHWACLFVKRGGSSKLFLSTPPEAK